MDLDHMLEKTVQIIKKYYAHSKKVPVLTYKSPRTLSQQIDLQIKKEGIPLQKVFSELEKIALNSPKTSSK